MAQSSKSAQTGNSNSYMQLTVGFRFGSEAGAEEDDSADDGWKTEDDAQPAAKEQKKK